MINNDIVNLILQDAHENYLNGIETYKCEIPYNSFQDLYNKAIDYLIENQLVSIKERNDHFIIFSLTEKGITCASFLK